jgi:hypothetical protein
MYNDRQYQYKYIAGITSPVVFTGAGILHSIVFNAYGTGGTVTITDTSSPSATVGIIAVPSTAITIVYDIPIANGMQITTSASPNITVTWQK